MSSQEQLGPFTHVVSTLSEQQYESTLKSDFAVLLPTRPNAAVSSHIWSLQMHRNGALQHESLGYMLLPVVRPPSLECSNKCLVKLKQLSMVGLIYCLHLSPGPNIKQRADKGVLSQCEGGSDLPSSL